MVGLFPNNEGIAVLLFTLYHAQSNKKIKKTPLCYQNYSLQILFKKERHRRVSMPPESIVIFFSIVKEFLKTLRFMES